MTTVVKYRCQGKLAVKSPVSKLLPETFCTLMHFVVILIFYLQYGLYRVNFYANMKNTAICWLIKILSLY
jgi:hypothetical protein